MPTVPKYTFLPQTEYDGNPDPVSGGCQDLHGNRLRINANSSELMLIQKPTSSIIIPSLTLYGIVLPQKFRLAIRESTKGPLLSFN